MENCGGANCPAGAAVGGKLFMFIPIEVTGSNAETPTTIIPLKITITSIKKRGAKQK